MGQGLLILAPGMSNPVPCPWKFKGMDGVEQGEGCNSGYDGEGLRG